MRIIAPDYYPEFRCIAGACRHTCCEGWEIDIDEELLAVYRTDPDIAPQIEEGETPHFRLLEGERCPFLNAEGLCELILKHGEGILCQICRDHPRFRNYWSDREEIGLGLVCEEAARLILSREMPMRLICIGEDDEGEEECTDDEAWLMALRDDLLRCIADGRPNADASDEDGEWLLEIQNAILSQIDGCAPSARLMEYLIYRHIANALYDDCIEERVAFVLRSHAELMRGQAETDGSIERLVDLVRVWSYDNEYDDESIWTGQ